MLGNIYLNFQGFKIYHVNLDPPKLIFVSTAGWGNSTDVTKPCSWHWAGIETELFTHDFYMYVQRHITICFDIHRSTNVLFFGELLVFDCGQPRNHMCENSLHNCIIPDNRVHGANMGPTWVLSAPDGPHLGSMNLAIRVLHGVSLVRSQFVLCST